MDSAELVSVVTKSDWFLLASVTSLVLVQVKEWEWLVRTELTAKLEAIDRHLEECSKKLSLFPIAGECVCRVLV